MQDPNKPGAPPIPGRGTVTRPPPIPRAGSSLPLAPKNPLVPMPGPPIQATMAMPSVKPIAPTVSGLPNAGVAVGLPNARPPLGSPSAGVALAATLSAKPTPSSAPIVLQNDALGVRPLPQPSASSPGGGAPQPSAVLGVGVQPSAPLGLQPSAPLGLQPSAPLGVQPSAPLGVQPSAPLGVQPSAPLGLQPSAPLGLQPSAPLGLQPSAPGALQPSGLGAPSGPLSPRAPGALAQPSSPPALGLGAQPFSSPQLGAQPLPSAAPGLGGAQPFAPVGAQSLGLGAAQPGISSSLGAPPSAGAQAPVFGQAQPPVASSGAALPAVAAANLNAGIPSFDSLVAQPDPLGADEGWGKIGVAMVAIAVLFAGGVAYFLVTNSSSDELEQVGTEPASSEIASVALDVADAGTQALAGSADAAVEIAAAAVDPDAVDPAAVDPGAVDPAVVDPGAVDPAVVALVENVSIDAGTPAVDVPPVDVPGSDALLRANGEVDRPASLVSLTIESEPSGARVVRKRDRIALGLTPFHYEQESASGLAVFVIEKDGYSSTTLKMPANRDGIRQVVLLPGRGKSVAVAKPTVAEPPKTKVEPKTAPKKKVVKKRQVTTSSPRKKSTKKTVAKEKKPTPKKKSGGKVDYNADPIPFD